MNAEFGFDLLKGNGKAFSSGADVVNLYQLINEGGFVFSYFVLATVALVDYLDTDANVCEISLFVFIVCRKSRRM